MYSGVLPARAIGVLADNVVDEEILRGADAVEDRDRVGGRRSACPSRSTNDRAERLRGTGGRVERDRAEVEICSGRRETG